MKCKEEGDFCNITTIRILNSQSQIMSIESRKNNAVLPNMKYGYSQFCLSRFQIFLEGKQMDCTHWLSILSTCLTLFSFVQPSLGYSPTQELIGKICLQTPNYAHCNNVFHKILPSPLTNEIDLTQISLIQSILNATNTRIIILRAKAVGKDKTRRDLYDICNISYGVVMEALENANLEFEKRDYLSMINSVSSCERPVNNCQNVFGSNIVMKLSVGNRQMELLTRMSLASGNLLLCGL